MIDSATAYEINATRFLDNRDRSTIGANVVRQWAESIDQSSEVLEIGCGSGYPITLELVDVGLKVWAIDSSPSLLDEFRARVPNAECRCERLQDSTFFERKFSAVVAVGVLFLLPADEQIKLLMRVTDILEKQGKFIFTAPVETGGWYDNITGLECVSLGSERYRSELISLGFENIKSIIDSGKNHYYVCEYCA